MNNKSILIIIIIIIVAIVGYGFFSYRKTKDNFPANIEVKEFIGEATKVDDQTLNVKGFYVFENKNLNITNDKRVVVVKIDPSTKLTKERIYLPSSKELEKNNGSYDPAELRREKFEGSLEDFKNSESKPVAVTIRSNQNIYNQFYFLASEVNYTDLIYP